MGKLARSVAVGICQTKDKPPKSFLLSSFGLWQLGFSKRIILVGINWSKRKAKHDVKIDVIE